MRPDAAALAGSPRCEDVHSDRHVPRIGSLGSGEAITYSSTSAQGSLLRLAATVTAIPHSVSRLLLI
jgi:hypothetical protein